MSTTGDAPAAPTSDPTTSEVYVAPRERPPSPHHRVYRVTPRQLQALYWLSFGRTVRMVGNELGVTENTARTLLRGLYRNLDVSTAAEAVRVGFETGLLAPRVDRIGAVVGRPSGGSPVDPIGYAAHRGQPAPPDLGVPRADRARGRRDEHDQAAGA